jgi:serralysin
MVDFDLDDGTVFAIEDVRDLTTPAREILGSNGALKSTAFWSNKTGKAHDANDRIIYDKDSGVLYYDAEGTGTVARIAFATITKNLSMTYKDFYVI